MFFLIYICLIDFNFISIWCVRSIYLLYLFLFNLSFFVVFSVFFRFPVLSFLPFFMRSFFSFFLSFLSFFLITVCFLVFPFVLSFFLSPPFFRSFFLSVVRWFCRSVFLSVYVSIYLSIYLSFFLSAICIVLGLNCMDAYHIFPFALVSVNPKMTEPKVISKLDFPSCKFGWANALSYSYRFQRTPSACRHQLHTHSNTPKRMTVNGKSIEMYWSLWVTRWTGWFLSFGTLNLSTNSNTWSELLHDMTMATSQIVSPDPTPTWQAGSTSWARQWRRRPTRCEPAGHSLDDSQKLMGLRCTEKLAPCAGYPPRRVQDFLDGPMQGRLG